MWPNFPLPCHNVLFPDLELGALVRPELQVLGGDPRPREVVVDVRQTRMGHGLGPERVTQQAHDGLGELRMVFRIGHQAMLAVHQLLGHPGVAGHHHWGTRGHGLQADHAERLMPGRVDEHPSPPVEGGQLVLGPSPQEEHLARDSILLTKCVEPPLGFPLLFRRVVRAPKNHQGGIREFRLQVLERLQTELESLGPREPTTHDDHGSAGLRKSSHRELLLTRLEGPELESVYPRRDEPRQGGVQVVQPLDVNDLRIGRDGHPTVDQGLLNQPRLLHHPALEVELQLGLLRVSTHPFALESAERVRSPEERDMEDPGGGLRDDPPIHVVSVEQGRLHRLRRIQIGLAEHLHPLTPNERGEVVHQPRQHGVDVLLGHELEVSSPQAQNPGAGPNLLQLGQLDVKPPDHQEGGVAGPSQGLR